MKTFGLELSSSMSSAMANHLRHAISSLLRAAIGAIVLFAFVVSLFFCCGALLDSMELVSGGLQGSLGFVSLLLGFAVASLWAGAQFQKAGWFAGTMAVILMHAILGVSILPDLGNTRDELLVGASLLIAGVFGEIGRRYLRPRMLVSSESTTSAKK